ncbi:MAG: ERAP1-like C-terminal domain-containing protein, partial [Candidatus Nanopelagicales bacterium]
ATWDMTRDAEIGTADYLKLVLAGLPHEGDVGVVQQVIRQLRTAIDVYATDDHRLRYQSELADALLTMTRRADAGSDHQLAFARGFIATASSEEALNLVAGLHGGTEQISGLEIDTEMRWSLLQRLVIMGRAGRAQIATELARDNTATGQRHVAFLEAAIPSPEAKAAAWHAALHDAELPNHLLAATIGGIMVSEQRELLRPHVAEYFDSIPATWADRTPEMAQQIVAGLYPMLLVDPQIAARSQRFLAENAQLAAGARRLVGEGLDGLERAMRCQERDGLGG